MYSFLSLLSLDAMEDPKDLEQLFFIMNNNNSDELSTLSICQKFIKRITFSDSATAFTGVISDELLTQQDSLFSFSEVIIPRSPIHPPSHLVPLVLNNLRLLAQLYNITRYTDMLDVYFERNSHTLSPR